MRAKKIILWTVGVIVALIVIVIGGGLLLLQHNQSFRADLLHRLERSINESTGARLTVRDFKLRLASLQLDLYGIVVHGTEAPSQRPLLTVDHLGIGIKIDSLLGRKWHLRNLTADHPVASIFVNKAGENNLPKSKNPSSSHTNIFQLGVEHAAINDGEIYYNDQKKILDAALRNLELAAGYDRAQSRYFGDLHYSDGRIQYGEYAPVVHNLDAKFEITPDTFKLTRVLLETGHSRFVLNASIEDYANSPRMQAVYDALLATPDAARILKNPSIPAGDIRLTGSLKYQSQPNRPMLDTLALSGNVSSGELRVSTSNVRTVVRDLRAHYAVDNGNASVEGLHLQLLGGVLNGNLVVRDLTGAQQGRFQAKLQGVSLDQLQVLSHSRPLQQARLSGSVNADTYASWTKSLKNLIAHADAAINAHLGQNPATPLNGVMHADYRGTRQEVALHQSYIRTPHTSITLDGTISNRCQLQVNMNSSDLHELELLSAGFRAPSPGSSGTPESMGLYGTARLNAAITGSLSDPQIRGHLEADSLRVKGSSWKVLRTDLNVNPASVSLQKGQLQSAKQGHFNFSLQAGLRHWSYQASNPINVSLSGSQLSLEELEQFAGKSYPVSGTLALKVSVHGSQLNPVGQGNFAVTNAVVSSEAIQNITVDFQGNGRSVNTSLNMRMAAGTAHAHATIDPRTRAYQFQLHADNIRLEQLQHVRERNMQLAGGINLDASGRGTIQSPELDATLAIPQLRVRNQDIRGVTLRTTVRNQVANIALDSEVAQVFVKARGTLGIRAPYNADLRLDTGRIEFQPLVALYSPAQAGNVTGQTEIHVSVRGPLENKSRLEAHLDIPMLTATYKQLQIGSARPIRADLQNGIAVLQPTTLAGTDTNLNIQASVPVTNINAASLTLKGAVDLRILQLVTADLQSRGKVEFDIDSHHSGGMGGQIRIVNASVYPADVPVGFDHANGVINVSPSRADIASFQAQMAGGTLSAKGGVSFRPALQFGLGLQATNVRLRYPDGIRALLGSTLSLTGTPQNSMLSGQVRIERVSFTPDFDLTSFAGQFGGASSAAPAPGGIMNSMRLNIAMQSTSQMNLQSSQVSISGNANVRVVGTAANPVVLGRADLTGGELFFGGHRYVVQNGTIDFLNPVRTEPVLNLHVQTKIDQYNISLGLQGPVARLHTTYTSDPALPPADIINLIARGQTTEAAAAQPSQPLSLGAESLVASTVTNQIGSKIAKAAGISELQIDPSLGANNGQNPGARIAIQQRVTSSLFVTFATDVTSTQREAIELQYQFNRRWSATGVRDQNGGFTVQGYYNKKF